jgi:hypothetical protein
MSSLNLILKPAQIELVARPGITITQAYSVVNNSDTSVMLSTGVAPWKPEGTDGTVSYENVLPNPNFQFSLSNTDLKLGQSFILRPRETRQLVLKIKSAPKTSLSDSYFTFFVIQDQVNSINPDSTQLAASGRLGSHILLSTSTSENPSSQASLSDFKASPLFKDIFFPTIRLEALANNKSDYFFKTTGKLSITKNNLLIKEFDLYPQNVLSNSSRQITCTEGNEPVPCTLNPPFWPGQYTATLNLDPTLSSPAATITFFVFPYSLVIILLFSLGFFLLLSRFLRRAPPTQPLQPKAD